MLAILSVSYGKLLSGIVAFLPVVFQYFSFTTLPAAAPFLFQPRLLLELYSFIDSGVYVYTGLFLR